MIVNIHDAKTHFSKLVERVAQGEEIVIGRAGKPVARLVPYEPTHERRKPGAWKGKVKLAPDFDETPEELIAAFEQ
jgi:prevent-host-death family protein